MRIVFVTAMLLLTGNSVSERVGFQAARPVTMVIVSDGAGAPKGSFQVRAAARKPGDALALRIYLPDRRDVHDRDGVAVSGFGFWAWEERGSTHVQIFELVPGPGRPNQYLAGPKDDPEHSLQPKVFANYTLTSVGKATPISEMGALGLKPMVIRLDARKGP